MSKSLTSMLAESNYGSLSISNAADVLLKGKLNFEFFILQLRSFRRKWISLCRHVMTSISSPVDGLRRRQSSQRMLGLSTLSTWLRVASMDSFTQYLIAKFWRMRFDRLKWWSSCIVNAWTQVSDDANCGIFSNICSVTQLTTFFHLVNQSSLYSTNNFH